MQRLAFRVARVFGGRSEAASGEEMRENSNEPQACGELQGIDTEMVPASCPRSWLRCVGSAFSV